MDSDEKIHSGYWGDARNIAVIRCHKCGWTDQRRESGFRHCSADSVCGRRRLRVGALGDAALELHHHEGLKGSMVNKPTL